ncbi:MAG: hypothetical protein ACLP9Y_12585 [Mycobacterium sp.]
MPQPRLAEREAFDLTGSGRDAAVLAGCSHHTVAQHVRARAEGRLTPRRAEQRPMLIDPFLQKLEEVHHTTERRPVRRAGHVVVNRTTCSSQPY